MIKLQRCFDFRSSFSTCFIRLKCSWCPPQHNWFVQTFERPGKTRHNCISRICQRIFKPLFVLSIVLLIYFSYWHFLLFLDRLSSPLKKLPAQFSLPFHRCRCVRWSFVNKAFPSNSFQRKKKGFHFWAIKRIIRDFFCEGCFFLANTSRQFYQHSTKIFYTRRSWKRKKILLTKLYFLHFRDLRA